MIYWRLYFCCNIRISLVASTFMFSSFFLIFLCFLLPFFLVNGVLTGSFIEGEVVWYDNTHNLGIRLFTIPVEDVVYAFSLIITNLFLLELFEVDQVGGKAEYADQ
mgnify:CR=1 FL=1